MNLTKAIEILKKEQEDTFMGSEEDWKNAIQLSIEALELIKRNRGYPSYIIPRLLPGETED